MDSPIENNMSKTYRYEFSEDFCAMLSDFAKIHQYDDRKVFKEAWNVWVEDNTDQVEQECRAIYSDGYEGDAIDKMFKSARYYFRKKSVQKKEQVPRKSYEKTGAELLKKIDMHIKANLDMKPHDSYIAFCQKMREEESSETEVEVEVDEEKLKKTFKNRYSTAKKAAQRVPNM
jgi:hypothetical protein